MCFFCSSGRASSNYNHCPERRVFQCETKNRSCKWRSDVDKDSDSDSDTETASKGGTDKSSERLGHKDITCDGESEDRTKVALNRTPSRSKKQDIINDSCDKMYGVGSPCISSGKRISKEYPEHLGTPQQRGRSKVTHNHCNLDAEGHGFEINKKGREDMSHSSVKSGVEHTEEIMDDDDDNIPFYRHSHCSSLHYGKETKKINKTVCLNSQSMSVRNASDNTVSGPSVTYERRTSMGTVFSSARSHGATLTPNDGASVTKEVLLTTRTKTMSLNHSARSGCPDSEDHETGDTGNPRKGNAVTQSAINTKTLHNFNGSHFAKYKGGTPKRASVLSRDRSATATSNHIDSGHSENEDGRSFCVFSDSCDDDDSSEKEYITPIHKLGRKSSNHLFRLGRDKNEVVIVDCGKNSGVDDSKDSPTDLGTMPNRTNVITSKKRWSDSLNTSVTAKQVETDCSRSPDSSHLIASDHGKNENQMTDDGKCPDSENHLRRSKRGVKIHTNSVRSKCSEKENDITDNMRHINERTVLTRKERGAATILYRQIGLEHSTHEDVRDKEDMFSDDGNDSKKENIFNRTKRTGTPKHHDKNDDNDSIVCTTLKHSWFSERKTTADTCGNRNSTPVKSSRRSTYAGVTSSHTETLLTGSNITRKPLHRTVKRVSFVHEDKENVSSSDETSTGIEELLTDSYRRKISGDMKHFPRKGKSDDSLCRMKRERKLMKNRRAETRERLPTGPELLENEKEIACDILYTPAKRVLFYEKKKEQRLDNVHYTENINCQMSGKSFNSNSSHNMSRIINVSRESVECSAVSVVCEAGNTVDTVFSHEKTPTGIESHRKQFSGDTIKETRSHNKSESGIHNTNRTRTQKGRDHSFTSKHPGNEEEIIHHDFGVGDDDDDDSIFHQTLSHSWFNDKGKADNTCGNRNSTSLKSGRSNTDTIVPSSHSQVSLTRSPITRKRRPRSVKPMRFVSEGMENNGSSSDGTSTGIEDLFTDSYRWQISGNVTRQSISDDKSYNTIHIQVQQQRCRRSSRLLQNVLKMKNR
jgi:hypothetical protein